MVDTGALWRVGGELERASAAARDDGDVFAWRFSVRGKNFPAFGCEVAAQNRIEHLKDTAEAAAERLAFPESGEEPGKQPEVEILSRQPVAGGVVVGPGREIVSSGYVEGNLFEKSGKGLYAVEPGRSFLFTEHVRKISVAFQPVQAGSAEGDHDGFSEAAPDFNIGSGALGCRVRQSGVFEGAAAAAKAAFRDGGTKRSKQGLRPGYPLGTQVFGRAATEYGAGDALEGTSGIGAESDEGFNLRGLGHSPCRILQAGQFFRQQAVGP